MSSKTHLRLDDRHEAILLADGCISSQCVSILLHRQRRGSGTEDILNVQDRAPLREAGTSCVVLGTTSIKIIDTLEERERQELGEGHGNNNTKVMSHLESRSLQECQAGPSRPCPPEHQTRISVREHEDGTKQRRADRDMKILRRTKKNS